MLDGLQSALETLQNATNQLNDAIVQLDEAANEIESVIWVWAGASEIAQKFVDDYTPLEQTKQIVN